MNGLAVLHEETLVVENNFQKLCSIGPYGLWTDEQPVPNAKGQTVTRFYPW